MSYAADMGAERPYTREEMAQREREVVDKIAKLLGLQPISGDQVSAFSLGVAWGTEHAYALTDILAELTDQREPQQYTMQEPNLGIVLGDEFTTGPMHTDLQKADRDFHDPHVDCDPAEHTIPYGWIRTVADAHYGGHVPKFMQDMQIAPATLCEEFGRCQQHAVEVGHVITAMLINGQPAPGIFTERLQAVNSCLQQVDNETQGGGDAEA